MASDEVTPISQLGYEKCRDELIEVVRLLEQGGLGSRRVAETVGKRRAAGQTLRGALSWSTSSGSADVLAAGESARFLISQAKFSEVLFQTGTRFSYSRRHG